ncbi:MAG TPA: helix-turn-helix domain-containing protein [Povalibacter sp.]|nr:helix-turn-helix domain-containing protein [Povalibacter sp.]
MIGKTRHESADGAIVTLTDGVGPARGMLRGPGVTGKFWHSRTAPDEGLRDFVEHFWIVRWDLTGHAPQQSETLPHPNVHLVLARNDSRIAGPHTSRFVRTLEGGGQVLGVKFRPGGFHPFFRKPIATLADTSLPLADVFGDASGDLEETVLAQEDDAAMIDAVSCFLLERRPIADPRVDEVSHIVASIVHDRSITSVDHLVQRHALDKRALQRLFAKYVGVSPKWVINRYRLHDALERLAQGVPVDWASVALDLGYFDQAHFIRDFRRLVGRTPLEYARSLTPAG